MDDNPELGVRFTFLIDKYSVELENWLNDTVLTKTSQVIMTVSLSVINILKGLAGFHYRICYFLFVVFWQARKSLPDRQKWHMLSLNRSPPTDRSKVFVLLTIPLSDSLAVKS